MYYIFWVCVCSLRYPAHNAHAPYCHLCPAPLYNIFPHYLINGTILEREKKLQNTKCVFWFSVQLLCETFLILRRTERDVVTVYRSSSKVPVLGVIFWWDLNFLDRSSKNFEIPNFMKIRPMGVQLFHKEGRTDGHDEANSRFSANLRTRLKILSSPYRANLLRGLAK